jgi:hypothetical protein
LKSVIGLDVFASVDQPRSDGFVDPDQKDQAKLRMDSVKDLKLAFGDKKKYQLVDDRNDADVAIQVVERGTRIQEGVSHRSARTGVVGAVATLLAHRMKNNDLKLSERSKTCKATSLSN